VRGQPRIRPNDGHFCWLAKGNAAAGTNQARCARSNSFFAGISATAFRGNLSQAEMVLASGDVDFWRVLVQVHVL
jgi:hypothetical protein